jgi:LytS/YehU family sensor histidine kinase
LQTGLIATQMNGFADFFRYSSYRFPVVFAASILPVCIFSVYFSLYILFPLLHRKKYFLFAAGFVAFVGLNCFIELFLYLLARPFTCSDCGVVTLQEKINIIGAIGINTACFWGVVALGIKFTKSWYLQQINNHILARQKIRSQLKLLKARIQPDFLFGTLQALHSKIILDKKKAAEMLLKFSDLLSYTLYECEDDFIDAEKVFQITDEFFALEKMMMKTNITTVTTISGDICNKYIPSFIVLPLIQHCVTELHNYPDKAHSAKIKLSATNNMFYCSIQIETDAFAELRKMYVDGINMFTNRLETFYTNKYTLDFTEEQEEFNITLSLVLVDNLSAEKTGNATEKVYANTAV